MGSFYCLRTGRRPTGYRYSEHQLALASQSKQEAADCKSVNESRDCVICRFRQHGRPG